MTVGAATTDHRSIPLARPWVRHRRSCPGARAAGARMSRWSATPAYVGTEPARRWRRKWRPGRRGGPRPAAHRAVRPPTGRRDRGFASQRDRCACPAVATPHRSPATSPVRFAAAPLDTPDRPLSGQTLRRWPRVPPPARVAFFVPRREDSTHGNHGPLPREGGSVERLPGRAGIEEPARRPTNRAGGVLLAADGRAMAVRGR